MVGKTKHRTKADELRLDAITEIACVPCMIDGWPGEPPTVQHCTDGGKRMPDQHQKTYFSCDWHHLGKVPNTCGGSVQKARDIYGPSFAHNKRKFAAHYGTELQLIKIQDALCRIQVRARKRGEYLSGHEYCLLARQLHREIVKGIPPTA